MLESLFLIKLQALRPANMLKETPTQVFSNEIWNIFKNTYFEEHLQTTASVMTAFLLINMILIASKI